MKAELQAGAAPEPGSPARVARRGGGGVAEGRNEEEDGKAVAGAAGSARTFLGTELDRGRSAAEKAAQRAAGKRKCLRGQWIE